VGSSHERLTVFSERRAGACPSGSRISFDSIPGKASSFVAGSLRFGPEPAISRFRRPRGEFCHEMDSSPSAHFPLSTQSPCHDARRNRKVWIA